MDTMTLMHLRGAQSSRMNRRSLTRLSTYPARAVPQLAARQPVQPPPQTDAALAQLVDLGLQTVVPVQYQIVKTGGAVLESPTVPGVVKLLVFVAVSAAAISGGKEIGRVLDNLLS
jgi:hypothetical protein